MAVDSSQQIVIIVLGLILAALICKTFKSSSATNEPFQTKLTYRESSPATPSSMDQNLMTQNSNSDSDSSMYNLSQNDQNHFDFASMAGISKAADFASQQNKSTKSSAYVDPASMLPQGDMNSDSTLMRDPSKPGNWVYDRPVFSLSKSTNRNEGDPIRGDLQITSEKTGWFDSSLARTDTLKRGYVGNFMDTQQIIDLQDVIYSANKTPDQQNYLQSVQKQFGSSAVQPDLRFGNSHENLAV